MHVCSETFFCDDTLQTIFSKQEPFAISDIEKYGKQTNKNQLIQEISFTRNW